MNKKLSQLNKYVIKADTEKNEWTFTGEIWKGIEALLKDQRQDIIEMIEKECVNFMLKEYGQWKIDRRVIRERLLSKIKLLKLK